MYTKKTYLFIIDKIENGGAEKQMIGVCSLLIKSGFDVTVSSLCPPTLVGQQLLSRNNINYVSLGGGDRLNLYSPFKVMSLIRGLIARYNIDTCVSFLEWSNLYTIVSCFGLDVRVVCNVRNHLTTQYKSKGWAYILFSRLAIGTLYRFATRVICNSNGIVEDLSINYKVPRKIMSTIYNGYDVEHIKSSAEALLSSDYTYLSKYEKVYISVGRLTEQKRFSSLIRTFCDFQERNKLNDILLIVGDGPQSDELKSMVSGRNVRLIGNLDNPFNLMSKSDCFILHSKFEGFPNVLAEACILNLDILSVDCFSGPREILSNGRLNNYVTKLHRTKLLDNGLLYAMWDNDEKIDEHLMEALEKYQANSDIKIDKDDNTNFFDKSRGEKEWLDLL